MGFWWYTLAISLVIPCIMVLAGYCMAKHPPKKINHILGYRTAKSMKNQKSWRLAHHVAGRFWMKWGAILLLPSAAVMAILRGQNEDVLGVVSLVLALLQLIPLFAVIPVTEKALSNADDKPHCCAMK